MQIGSSILGFFLFKVFSIELSVPAHFFLLETIISIVHPKAHEKLFIRIYSHKHAERRTAVFKDYSSSVFLGAI